MRRGRPFRSTFNRDGRSEAQRRADSKRALEDLAKLTGKAVLDPTKRDTFEPRTEVQPALGKDA